MLVTATACIAATRHRRTSMPKTAKKQPAATNRRSPPTPCAPMVRNASAPITARPRTMTSAPTTRRAGNGSFNTTARQDHAAQRRAGRLDDAAMAERNKQITEIAQKRERQPAKHRERKSAASIRCRRDRASRWRQRKEAAPIRAKRSGAARGPRATRRRRCHDGRRQNRAPSTRLRRRRKPRPAPLHVLPAEEQVPFRRGTDEDRRAHRSIRLCLRQNSFVIDNPQSRLAANIICCCRARQCANCHGRLRQARSSFRLVGVGVFEKLKPAGGHDAAGLEPHHLGRDPPEFGRGVADVDHGHAGIVAEPHQVRKDFALVS